MAKKPENKEGGFLVRYRFQNRITGNWTPWTYSPDVYMDAGWAECMSCEPDNNVKTPADAFMFHSQVVDCNGNTVSETMGEL